MDHLKIYEILIYFIFISASIFSSAWVIITIIKDKKRKEIK